jgi:hypothetical protein
MKEKITLLISICVVAVIIIIYSPWFMREYIIGGDWPFYFDEYVQTANLAVPSWSTGQGNGMGGINPVYFLQIFQNSTFFISSFFHLPWVITYKLTWFLLFIVLGFYSSFSLAKYMLHGTPITYRLFAPLIFLTNTYILMVVAGGQMGVALAYAIGPLVFLRFLLIVDSIVSEKEFSELLRMSFLTGIALAVQVLLDPRIVYITLVGFGLYFLYKSIPFVFERKQIHIDRLIRLVMFTFLIPGVITLLLHAAWIVPSVLVKERLLSQLGDAYTGSGIVKFLSFADMSHTISLLHPNWPENIFGKVSFLKSEFLLLPLIAFASLLFYHKKTKESENLFIPITVIIGIFGVFLAKGATEPFGNVYLFLFENVPGFVLFRDPTKWYLLIIIAYSILIPSTTYALSSLLRKNKMVFLPLLMFVVIWSLLIHQALLHTLPGTFAQHELPEEYIRLKNTLVADSAFSRTMSIPRQSRFTYSSDLHPTVDAFALMRATTSAEIIEKLREPVMAEVLARNAIKYVIIPYDSLGEIFLKDRKYNPIERERTEVAMDAISWLRKIQSGKLAVYEVPNVRGHFWMERNQSSVMEISSQSITYTLRVRADRPSKLIFAENYSPYWEATIGTQKIPSVRTDDNLNSFFIPESQNGTVTVFYTPEQFYAAGRLISLVTFLGVICGLIILSRRNYAKK